MWDCSKVHWKFPYKRHSGTSDSWESENLEEIAHYGLVCSRVQLYALYLNTGNKVSNTLKPSVFSTPIRLQFWYINFESVVVCISDPQSGLVLFIVVRSSFVVKCGKECDICRVNSWVCEVGVTQVEPLHNLDLSFSRLRSRQKPATDRTERFSARTP